MTNAEQFSEYVEKYPGLTIFGLMKKVRRGIPTKLSYWYRDAYRAVELGLIDMDDERKLHLPTK